MAIDKDLLVMIKSNGLGDGEPDLGEKLMKAWLEQLWESGARPSIIAFLNSGVFLTTEDSPVIDLLEKFSDSGTRILSCGTCLAYYDRTEKLLVGEPTNMKDTVGSMLSYKKILAP